LKPTLLVKHMVKSYFILVRFTLSWGLFGPDNDG
jgi:hypothetical protein